MKNGFTDVQTFPSKETLFQEEIDALLTVVLEVLDLFDNCPNKGTIILDGQRKGEDAQCIMRMNLEGGIFQKAYSTKHSADSDWTSSRMAEESIDAILKWPAKNYYDYKADPKYFGEMLTGIYGYYPLEAMVVNTTFGRFLISAHLAKDEALATRTQLTEYFGVTRCLMRGMAVALGKMCPQDLVLQDSVKRLYRDWNNLEGKKKEEVEKMFCFCNLPALAAWKKWHDAEMEKGSLGLYFQE